MISGRIKSSIVIRRPVEEVFRFLATEYFENTRRLSPPSDAQVLMEFPAGPIGVGSHGHSKAEDARGFMVESDMVVTEYVPHSRFVVDHTSMFAEEQPNKLPPARYAKSKTLTHVVYLFEPAGEGTLLRVEAVYSLDMSVAYLMYMPWWSSNWREQTQQRMVNLRNILEMEAGLAPLKPRILIRRSWIGWTVYFVVLAVLLWVHGAKDALELSQQWGDTLRTTLSLMIVGAIMFIVATKSFVRR